MKKFYDTRMSVPSLWQARLIKPYKHMIKAASIFLYRVGPFWVNYFESPQGQMKSLFAEPFGWETSFPLPAGGREQTDVALFLLVPILDHRTL